MTVESQQNSTAFLTRWLDYVIHWVINAGGDREQTYTALKESYLDQYLDSIMRAYRQRRPYNIIVTTGISAARALLYAPILDRGCRLVDGKAPIGPPPALGALVNERRVLANMFAQNMMMAQAEVYNNGDAVLLIKNLKDIMKQPLFNEPPTQERLLNYYDRERSLISI